MTWKLAMPAAENWQQLTDQLDVAEPDPEGKVTIEGDGTGMRWKFDEDMLERVASVLGVVFSIRVGDPREFIEGYGSLTYARLQFHHLPMLEDEKSPGTFGYKISVYPMLSPEAANYAIWHEIQHMFQFEEKRVDPMNMGYNPNLPMIGENQENYMKDPSETDADQMALKLHQLGQYPVVRTIPLLEGTEGAEYAQLVNEEGWPPDEAMQWVRDYVKTDEIPLSTVMTTRGLDDLQAPVSKVADYQGWTNWDTWHTMLLIDNERETNEKSRQLVEHGLQQGWAMPEIVQAFEEWAIPMIVGPHNNQSIQDAQEWNDIPPEERIDYNYENLKNENPQAADIVDGLGFGPDVSDTEPMVMTNINWYEIVERIKSDILENWKYEQDLPWQSEEKPKWWPSDTMTLPESWSRVRKEPWYMKGLDRLRYYTLSEVAPKRNK